MALVNTDVSGNWRAMELKEPGPMSPRTMTDEEEPLMRLSVLLRKLSELSTGKSGGKAKPAVVGSPVRFEMLKTLTPGRFWPAGIRLSNEISPRLTVAHTPATGNATNTRKS